MRVGAVLKAAGSAYIELGRTKIIASVFGPRDVVHRNSTQSALDLDLRFSPFSSLARLEKEEQERRVMLYKSLLLGALESVLLDVYASSVIDLNIMVLEDDGGALTAALTVASLALADAGIQLRDMAVGASVYLVVPAPGADAELRLDCDKTEEAAMAEGSAVLHFGFCPQRGKVCMLHSAGTASTLEQMVLLAQDTAKGLASEMGKCLQERRGTKRSRTQAEVHAEEGIERLDVE